MPQSDRDRNRKRRSAAWTALKSTGRIVDRGACGLARWAVTDHNGFARRLQNMPAIGWLDSLIYLVLHFLVQMVSVLVSAVLTGMLVAFGIPYLLTILLGD